MLFSHNLTYLCIQKRTFSPNTNICNNYLRQTIVYSFSCGNIRVCNNAKDPNRHQQAFIRMTTFDNWNDDAIHNKKI